MMARRLLLLAAAASLAATLLLPGPATALQVGDTCSADAACGSGLHCSACGGGGGGDRICARAAPIDPATHGTGLPFNNYSWLTTHNSFALAGAVSPTGAAIISPTNQEDTVTAQLKVTNRPIPTSPPPESRGGCWAVFGLQVVLSSTTTVAHFDH